MLCAYAVLAVVSNCYPPVWGRLPTRYSPVRHSVTKQSLRRDQVECFVRLACVKHAASVHPEPGSNSHVKKFSCPVINWLNQTCIWFTVLRLFLYRNVRVLWFTTPWNSLNLSRLFHCSVINVLCVVLSDSLFIISYQVCFVKNFFSFFWKFFSIGFVRSVHCLKRDNSDILSCVVLFVNNFFILFWKFFQNDVVRCKIMSHLAVSLTIISSVSSSVNSFFAIFDF